MKTTIELRKTRDFGQLISDTLGFIRENFKPLFKAVAVICGFFIAVTFLTNVLIDDSIFSAFNTARTLQMNPDAPQPFEPLGADYFLRVFFLCVSTMLSYIGVYLTTFCYISLYREKGNMPPTVEEVWAYFKYYFFRVLGSGLLVGIIMIFSLMLCGFGIYLIPPFALILPIIVLENASFSYAWGRSFKLIKDYWWQTFGVIFVIGLIVGFVGFFLAVPGQILLVVQMMVSTKKVTLPVTIVSGFLKSLILFLYTVPATAYSLCYFSLDEIKESTGLLDRIDSFGKTDVPDDSTSEEY
ncbi:hypothetical protein BEL04_18695 [Mucilaginibacter sp. PPCGB 2223]|uniref:hypothetical protein n=1 Tax=Mucilaginibacter sp. PPCGB 2223 TaxID=1886027 RepID=UPI0008262E9B|nr:hypothetical protein [Mucilaginibacter sp. PPCGB 2223]OCX50763.1 hypothetical protein BEL04_18695 [Mucilaginibacter sp. PPCGB 2223]